MENSNKSITMAEKRVGEMNKLTQGLLEQSNRYLRQKNQPQNMQPQASPPNAPTQKMQGNMAQNAVDRNKSVREAAPNVQNFQRQNVSPQNNVPFRNIGFQNRQHNPTPPKPRFETVGNDRRREPQPSSPPPIPEPQAPSCQSPQGSLLPLSLNSDTVLIAALAAVLVKEKADTKLILALLYILM